MMKREPVALIELIKIAINSAVVWVVVMGIWDMSDAQQTATVAFLIALVNVAGAFFQRRNVWSPKSVDLAIRAARNTRGVRPEDNQQPGPGIR